MQLSRKFILLTILSFCFVFSVFRVRASNQILWPLDIEISQSSSFAEFRGFRLHAGIDLRTKKAVGFPVRAIEDGFVSRLKVQYRGYGYALYIDHPKLEKRVVYGHLQDFKGAHAEYVKNKLARMKSRHGIDDFFKPDRFPVKKGQIIGLSGESGSGPPHLHFEVRTLADEPVAPAILGFRPKDKIFPRFYKIYLEPYSFPCEINQSFLPFEAKTRKIKHKTYKINDTIEVSGKAGIKAGVSDSNGVGNVYGVEKIELTLDKEPFFAREFYKYAYPQNNQCSLVFDYLKSKQRNTGYVINLFKLPGETLPFAKNYKTWSGIIDSNNKAGKMSSLKINAWDYGENHIFVDGRLTYLAADYKERLDFEKLSRASFAKIVSTPVYVVACGQFNDKKWRSFSRGSIECKDTNGSSEWLPVIIKGKTAEIAVPYAERWQGGAWVNDMRILPETTLVPTTGKTIANSAGGRAEFFAKSLLFPVYSRFFRANLSPEAGGNKKIGELKPFSPVWQLEPREVVFAGNVKIAIKPSEYEGNMQKLGIYKVSDNNNYYHVGEKLENGWLTAQTRLGGSWVILEDKVIPHIRYLRKGKDYHMGRVWVFKVSDVGEGVNYLSTTANTGGKKLEVYSDPDKTEIYVKRAAPGKKVLIELAVEDYAGNRATFKKTLN